MRLKISTCLLLFLAVLNLGSLVRCGGSLTPPEYSELFRLTREQAEQRFKQYSLEKQVDAYLWAMKGVEPPATEFAGFLASNGKKALPFILKRLKEEEWDGAKLHLIRALADMHTDYCSLKDEKEVIETISTVISTMKAAFYRNWSKEELEKILEKPGIPCA